MSELKRKQCKIFIIFIHTKVWTDAKKLKNPCSEVIRHRFLVELVANNGSLL